MNTPQMFTPIRVRPDTIVLPGYMPVPGMGGLAVNAHLILAREPVLVDTGLGALREPFVDALEAVLDPADLRWIWLTHADPDHTGALMDLLDRAPRAKVVTTYLGMGKLGMLAAIPPERFFLLNPNQALDVGDRRLHALRPPTFDAPETTAVWDPSTRVLFSSDSFGALTSEARSHARDIPDDELREGLITWTTVDAPWLHALSAEALDGTLTPIRDLNPTTILSAHLPPAEDMTEKLLVLLRAARSAPAFVGPDQQALLETLSAA